MSLKLTEGLSRDGVRPSQANPSPHALAPEGSERRKRRVPACGELKNSGALSGSCSRPVVGRGWHLRRHRVRGLNCWSPLTTASRDGYGPAQARLDDSGSTFGGCSPRNHLLAPPMLGARSCGHNCCHRRTPARPSAGFSTFYRQSILCRQHSSAKAGLEPGALRSLGLRKSEACRIPGSYISLLCSRSRAKARLRARSAGPPSARRAIAAQSWERSERRRLIKLLSVGC